MSVPAGGTGREGTGPGDTAVCEQVLSLVGDRAEARVTVTTGTAALTRFAESFIHQNVAEERRSVGLTVAVDGRVASASTTAVDAEALSRLVERALDAARLRPVDAGWPGVAPPGAAPEVDHHDAATARASPAGRAAVVERFVAADRDLRAAGYCDVEATEETLATTAGQRLTGRFTRATVDGVHQGADAAGRGHQTAHRLADLDGGAAGARAARLARDGADPVELHPGEYEVVLHPEAVATVLTFLAGAGFNARAVQQRRSFVRVGERQFDERVHLWDDATDPRAVGLAFDAEGTPKRRLELVRAGTSVGLAHDRRTALAAGVDSTGHAVPGGETTGAVCTNLFLGTGEGDTDALIAGMQRGLVVTQLHYCRVLDPRTLVVTGLTRNGTFLVERGEVVAAVAPLRFTQSFPAALAPGRVRAVGGTARFAGAESGPGRVVAPPLHLGAWRFTGGARG